MSEALKSLTDKAKDLSGQATAVLEQAGDQLGKLSELGGEATHSMVQDINQLLPAIQKAGYSVEGLDVDVALPPKFVVICKLQIQIAEAERAALLESIADSRVSTMAVKALFQLSDVQKNLMVGTLKPKEVLLEIGLSPAVRVRYRNEPATA